MKKITAILEKIGLTENEAGIYLALLSCGQSTVSDIAKFSGIKRATIYQYIDQLCVTNIIHKTIKGRRTLYYPENPKKLSQILEHKRKAFDQIFPELAKIYASGSHRPSIRFYEGKEGIRSVYREMTQTSKTLWSIFSANRYFETFSDKDGVEFVENIYQNGGNLRDLVQNSKLGKEYVKEKWGGKTAVSKLLPKGFEFSVDLMVNGDHVAMISFDKLIAVIIEDKEISQMQQNLIKFIWKNTK